MNDALATLGATPLGDGRTEFRLWAPAHQRVDLHIVSPHKKVIEMTPLADGYHTVLAAGAPAGAEYFFRLKGEVDRPDPASRLQGKGVHGPSTVVDPAHGWTDGAWENPPLDRHVIYEVHVGTLTPQGTFDAAIGRLDDLRALGITAIELMPVAEFPGSRNWGYDGVSLFAAHHAYGGPAGLRRFVDACHARGIAVILDVVYNHLGPEGNYLGEFGGYFTDRYKTPWGRALNFDDSGSDEVRRFFIENALYWVRDCHIDGLRLDAVHAIVDHSPKSFIEELGEAVHAEASRLGRRVHLIAESSDNDPRLITPVESGGLGMDTVWNDDYHHAIRTLLTGEKAGYYADYGKLDHLARAMTGGFSYSGQRSVVRGRRHGRPARGIPGWRFVVCCQNHDQIGNRMPGDRLEATAGFEGCKLAAGLVILSPFVPMLFMGEEYAEPAPFQYFVSHTDAALVEAVRKGRAQEFASFNYEGEVPDPQSPATFNQCKLEWGLRDSGRHAQMLAYYAALLRLRNQEPSLALGDPAAGRVTVHPTLRALALLRRVDGRASVLLANFETKETDLEPDLPAGVWEREIDSTDPKWGGRGPGFPATMVAGGAPVAVALPPRSVSLFTFRS